MTDFINAAFLLSLERMHPEFRRTVAALMTWEELEAAGLCECGAWLHAHPPLRKVSAASWHSERHSDQPWRNTVTGKVLTPAAQRWAGIHDPNARAGMVRVCKGCGGDMPIDRPKRAVYCTADCYQRNRQRRSAA